MAKPDAPVVIQVWGRPERCDLEAMKRAAGPFLPAPEERTSAAPALWEPGVLEGVATEAGLTPESAFDLSWAFAYPDEETLGRGMLAAGNLAVVADPPVREALRTAVVEALEPYRSGDGGYRLENEWPTWSHAPDRPGVNARSPGHLWTDGSRRTRASKRVRPRRD